MNFFVKQQHQTIYVFVDGEIGNQHNRKLEEEFQRLLARDFRDIVFDLSFVPYIQTVPLSIFINFVNQVLLHSKYIGLIGVNPLLENLFELVGLDSRVWVQTKNTVDHQNIQ